MIANGETFRDIRVHLDGGTFVNCTFENCDLIFSAVLPVHMDRCSFNNCRPAFIGSAGLAIQMMRGIYHGWGPNGRTVIDGIFDQIRKTAEFTGRAGSNPAMTS